MKEQSFCPKYCAKSKCAHYFSQKDVVDSILVLTFVLASMVFVRLAHDDTKSLLDNA